MGLKVAEPASPPDVTPAPATPEKVYRLLLPKAKPVHSPRVPAALVVVVPPVWRQGSKQRTVIRHDPVTKRYFIDEYNERMEPALFRADRSIRPVRAIFCRKFEFQIGLSVCSYYCEVPCADHIREIQRGWYADSLIPAKALVR